MLNVELINNIRRKNLINLKENGRGDVIDVISHFCPSGRGAEIGTFNGTFAGDILSRTDIAQIFCVDPYESYGDFHDSINKLDLDMIFEQANRFLSQFPGRFRFIRQFSTDAANSVMDHSLDFVYIDGNHQSAYVMQDLTAWWPKLRSGGIMMGDDAVDVTDEGRNEAGDIKLVHRHADDGVEELFGNYGVLHALRGFSNQKDMDFILTGSQFIMPKP